MKFIAIAGAVFLLTVASRWPLANYYSISVIWPASGLLWLAAVQRRKLEALAIIVGLCGWGLLYQGALGLLFALVSCLSPTIAWLLATRLKVDASELMTTNANAVFVLASVVAATLFSLVFFLSGTEPAFNVLNLWFVYFFVDLSSYLVFLPAVMVVVAHKQSWVQWRVIAVVFAILVIPFAISLFGLTDQLVKGSHLLVIPLLTWLAVSANKQTLAVSVLFIFTLQMVYSARGWMGYQPLTELFEFMQWYVVLFAVVITTLVLAYYSQHREQLLSRFKEQSIRDEQTGALNIRGLDGLLRKKNGQLFVMRSLDSAQLKADLSWQEFQVLEQAIVLRLVQLGSNDTVARLDAGEFAILLPSKNDGTMLRQSLNKPFSLNQRSIQLRFDISFKQHSNGDSTSVARCLNGLNLINQRNDDPIIDCDVRKEDIAYYEGLTHLHQYWLSKIDQGAMALHLQPIVRVEDSGFKAYEVLLRLDIDGVILPPSEILETFEVMNDLQTLDRLVMAELIRLLRQDVLNMTDVGYLSFNLTGTSIQSTSFVDELLQMWQNIEFPLNKIVIEITENEKIVDIDRAVQNTQRLRQAGFAIAIDDFGEGEASFAYLKRFPCDTVKIDGQFIRNIENSPQDQAIVSAIVQVAKVMNLRTVAEFVETDSLVSLLREMGVDYVQGYALGRPTPWSKCFSTSAAP